MFLFLLGEVVMYMLGLWMINSYVNDIIDFDWKVVLILCGEGGCGVMLGGVVIIVFNLIELLEVVVVFIDFFVS